MGLDLMAFLDEFRTEAGEHLRTLDAQLLALEKNPDDLAPVRSMFLAAHSLKGAGGMMDLADVEALGHAIEDVLSRLRDAKQRLDGATADTLFRAFDLLGERVARGLPGKAPVDAPIEQLVDALARCDGRTIAPPAAAPPTASLPPVPDTRPRALVVEDSATVRLLHATLLDRAGFLVDMAADGATGLDRATAHQYSVIVVGRELGGRRGLALIAAVRDRVEPSPLCILTHVGELADESEPAVGATLVVVAPPNAERLTALVQPTLARA